MKTYRVVFIGYPNGRPDDTGRWSRTVTAASFSGAAERIRDLYVVETILTIDEES